MENIIEFKTERLKLRQWKSSDLSAFSEMSKDKEVMAFFPSVLNRAESDSIAQKCQSLINKNGWGVWAVECIESCEFIGMVGLHVPNAKVPGSPCVEILWRLSRPHWGKGYATEAAKAVLKVGFERLKLNEIVAFAVLNNTPSRAVMERIGMVNTGQVFDHPDVPEPVHLQKHCVYKITQDSWMRAQTLA